MIKCDLIFYLSKKTSYCEKRLVKLLSPYDIEPNRILYSTSTTDLGIYTCESLNLTNIVILIGGLNTNGDENTKTILSRVLSSSGLSLKNARKLTSQNEEGYIVKFKKQMIIALPDNPDDIEEMLTEDLLKFIKESQK